MRTDFDGKRYDTTAAVKISTRPGADSHQELMQAPDGEYFLRVRRVFLEHQKSMAAGTNRFVQNEEIVPLSHLQALEWCLKAHIPKALHHYLAEYIRRYHHPY